LCPPRSLIVALGDRVRDPAPSQELAALFVA
jgi:hypothetical protein